MRRWCSRFDGGEIWCWSRPADVSDSSSCGETTSGSTADGADQTGAVHTAGEWGQPRYVLDDAAGFPTISNGAMAAFPYAVPTATDASKSDDGDAATLCSAATGVVVELLMLRRNRTVVEFSRVIPSSTK